MDLLPPAPKFNPSLIIYNGYPLSVFVAVTMHSLVLAFLLYMQAERPREILDIMQPPMVKAILVDENPQMRNERLLEEQRLVRVEQQRLEDQRRRDQEEQQRREQAAAEEARRQAAEQEALRQQELEARQQRERDAAAQREQQERARREAELNQQQERERQAREQQQRERELAAERESQRQAQEAAAAAVARTEMEMVQAYTGVIHDLVQRNWSRPPSARNGMTVVLRIQMVPTGDILDVQLVQSSGDPAFDRSAENAIFRVGRFTELQGMPINMFNENFRTLLLTFRPEDLLN